MTNTDELAITEISAIRNPKPKILVLGAVAGALIGLGVAYLVLQRAEAEEREVQMTAGEGVKLGLATFAFLRQVMQLGK